MGSDDFNSSNDHEMYNSTFDYNNYTFDYNNSTFDYNNYTFDYNNSDSCELEDHQENVIKKFQTSVFCVIFLCGIVGNCLVIATFAMYRRLRLRSMTDVFLFSLALADLLLLLTVPLQAFDTQVGWIFSDFLCKAMRACYAINTYSGLLLLACISVDRYILVTRAQVVLRMRRRIVTAGKLGAVGVWLFAISLSMPEILYSKVDELDQRFYCISGQVKMAVNGVIIGVFCLSFLIMVVCYSSIGWVLWRGHAQRRGKRGHHRRTLKLMLALVLVFLTFQLPYTVALSRKVAGHVCDLLMDHITCTLAYTRCSLNPVLYALVGVRFRRDVCHLFSCSGCPCGPQLLSKTSRSISASSAMTMASVRSPTSPISPTFPLGLSYSSNET